MITAFIRTWLSALIVGGGFFFSLASCQQPLQTLSIPPADIWTFYTSRSDNATFSCVPFGCFNSTGTGASYLPGADQLTVGFDRWYDSGTSPCNCWEYVSNAYRGLVRFKVEDFPKTFVTATLIVEVEQAVKNDGNTVSNEEAATIARILLASSHWWTSDPDTMSSDQLGNYSVTTATTLVPDLNVSAPGNPFIDPFPVSPPEPGSGAGAVSRKGGRYYIDASSQVRDWIKGGQMNGSFIFVGANEDLSEKTNGSQVATYKVTMEVLYNPNNK